MKKIFKWFFKWLKRLALGIIVFGVFSIIVLGFAVFDQGLAWENLNSNFLWFPYITLIIYRIAIYSVPGLVIYFISKIKKFKLNVTIIRSFEIQFITYAVVKLVWEFFALDFLWSTDLFEQMDSSIVLVGLLLSLVLGKKTKLETEIIK